MAKTKSLSSTSIQRLTLTTTCNMFSRQCLSYQLLTLISIVLYQSSHIYGFDIGKFFFIFLPKKPPTVSSVLKYDLMFNCH